MALIFVLLLPALASAEEELSVETSTTTMSLVQPEIHLLIQNNSDADREVLVQIGGDPQCEGEPRRITGTARDEIKDLSKWHRSWTIATLKGSGWTHRSYPLGIEVILDKPCSVGYVVSTADGQRVLAKGRITIHPQSTNPVPAPASPDAISVDWVVERDKKYRDLNVIRLRVRSDVPRVLEVAKREISCTKNAHASWAVSTVFQGEDTGPVSLGQTSWVVFVMPVTVSKSDASNCVGRLEIVDSAPDGSLRVLATPEVPLEAQVESRPALAH